MLYIVATPIGNLKDITYRAIEVLGQVDLIAAEDTRHTQTLLQVYGIKTPLISFHEHNEKKRLPELLKQLENGKKIAVVSDAGTPLVSDPGFLLVREAQKNGIPVIPIPGPCAAITALSASGLPSDHFTFEGFLPPKKGARCEKLLQLKEETRTLIFYESPHRVLESIEAMAEIFGLTRNAAIARELTKQFETVKSGTLEALLTFIKADPNQQKGEFVILVEGFNKRDDESLNQKDRAVLELLASELPKNKAAKLASQILGKKKNDLYAWLLDKS